MTLLSPSPTRIRIVSSPSSPPSCSFQRYSPSSVPSTSRSSLTLVLRLHQIFEAMLCFPVLVVAYLGYKIWFRTKWHDPITADSVSGRKESSEEDYGFLDKYYGQPAWKRALSYVRF